MGYPVHGGKTLASKLTMDRYQIKTRRLPDPDLWLSVELKEWAWEYSLSLSIFEGSDPVDEGDSLRIRGTTTFSKKVLPVQLRILGLSALRTDERSGTDRGSVGAVDRVRGGFDGVLAASDTAFPLLVSMLQANRYRRVRLALVKVARLNYEVQGYYFKHARWESEVDEDEWLQIETSRP
jgi:hypothetical protein